jgi:DNA-binding IscR family transcriptional regulator
MILIAKLNDNMKLTSDVISRSTGVNAVIIRNIFSKLKKAELLFISAGRGGIRLARDISEISLWDIYAAVETDETNEIFKFHPNPSEKCPIGRNIYTLLTPSLNSAVSALKKELSTVTLKDILNELDTLLESQQDSQPNIR